MHYETWPGNLLLSLGAIALVFSAEPDSDGRKTLSVTLIIGK